MTETKRLFTVKVEFDFAVMAEDGVHACAYVDAAMRDVSVGDCTRVTPTVSILPSGRFIERRPDADDGDYYFVYGTDTALTLNEAVAAEKERLKAEALAEKQAELFTKEKP
jgi:hypothetical protein